MVKDELFIAAKVPEVSVMRAIVMSITCVP